MPTPPGRANRAPPQPPGGSSGPAEARMRCGRSTASGRRTARGLVCSSSAPGTTPEWRGRTAPGGPSAGGAASPTGLGRGNSPQGGAPLWLRTPSAAVAGTAAPPGPSAAPGGRGRRSLFRPRRAPRAARLASRSSLRRPRDRHPTAPPESPQPGRRPHEVPQPQARALRGAPHNTRARGLPPKSAARCGRRSSSCPPPSGT
mmetsp:Transcript_5109/g.14324  ORF Transcript_5109/g.14324 Transcript_5109/m.14324 type:complete len:202 (+) Transcript_5109:1410-2015(+)